MRARSALRGKRTYVCSQSSHIWKPAAQKAHGWSPRIHAVLSHASQPMNVVSSAQDWQKLSSHSSHDSATHPSHSGSLHTPQWLISTTSKHSWQYGSWQPMHRPPSSGLVSSPSQREQRRMQSPNAQTAETSSSSVSFARRGIESPGSRLLSRTPCTMRRFRCSPLSTCAIKYAETFVMARFTWVRLKAMSFGGAEEHRKGGGEARVVKVCAALQIDTLRHVVKAAQELEERLVGDPAGRGQRTPEIWQRGCLAPFFADGGHHAHGGDVATKRPVEHEVDGQGRHRNRIRQRR